jgi:hypothetical protein
MAFKKGESPWNKGKRTFNNFVIKRNRAYLFLTRRKRTVIDRTDLESVLEHRWFPQKSRNTFYAYTIHGKHLHGFLTGYPMTDHKDGNGLNNWRSNLRPATYSINNQNRRTQRNSTTGYRGVGRYYRHGRIEEPCRYTSIIFVEKRRISLGIFDSKEEAAAAYNAAALEYYGPNARLSSIA